MFGVKGIFRYLTCFLEQDTLALEEDGKKSGSLG